MTVVEIDNLVLHGLSLGCLSLAVDVLTNFLGIRESSEHQPTSAAHSSAKTIVVDDNGFTTHLAAIREASSVGERRVEATCHGGILCDDLVEVEHVHVVVNAWIAALKGVQGETRIVSFNSVLVDLKVGGVPNLVNIAKNARARRDQTEAIQHSLPLVAYFGSVHDSKVVRIGSV